MITAVIDTNIFVQYLLSGSRSASVRTVEAYYDGRFRIAYSSVMFDELLEVLMLPHIRNRHGLTDGEILEYLASLLVDADRFPGSLPVADAFQCGLHVLHADGAGRDDSAIHGANRRVRREVQVSVQADADFTHQPPPARLPRTRPPRQWSRR
jgi:hypothetical protein